jgi:hypothetical protein
MLHGRLQNNATAHLDASEKERAVSDSGDSDMAPHENFKSLSPFSNAQEGIEKYRK